MTAWTFAGAPINEIDDFLSYTKGKEPFGFIYKLTHTPTGRKYIGKKNLYWRQTRIRAGRKKKITKQSDWLNYYGSSKDVLALIKEEGKENFTREILHICFTKRQLTYMEIKLLFSLGVLESDEYFNLSIQGKWHKGNLF